MLTTIPRRDLDIMHDVIVTINCTAVEDYVSSLFFLLHYMY